MFPIAQKYLDMIKERYKICKDLKLSRFDLQWGEYSRRMNIEIRELIQEGHKESEALKVVFALWVDYSNLLQLQFLYPNKLVKRGNKKRIITHINDFEFFMKNGRYKNVKIYESIKTIMAQFKM